MITLPAVNGHFLPSETEPASGAKPLHQQIGGQHYKKLAIQPVEYIHANNIGFFEGAVIKYVTRWRDKGGLEDLDKAKHFLDLLIDLESARDDRMERNTPKKPKELPTPQPLSEGPPHYTLSRSSCSGQTVAPDRRSYAA